MNIKNYLQVQSHPIYQEYKQQQIDIDMINRLALNTVRVTKVSATSFAISTFICFFIAVIKYYAQNHLGEENAKLAKMLQSIFRGSKGMKYLMI